MPTTKHVHESRTVEISIYGLNEGSGAIPRSYSTVKPRPFPLASRDSNRQGRQGRDVGTEAGGTAVVTLIRSSFQFRKLGEL